jgi:CRP/FNR family transcriptional regulator
MPNPDLISRWLATFPDLTELDEPHRAELLGATQFNRLREGDIAYRQGQQCQAYVMCIEGQTRVFKTSESGREILLYQVGPGETCVLTTSCLMAGQSLPGGEHRRDRRAARRAAGKRVSSADGRISALPQIRSR